MNNFILFVHMLISMSNQVFSRDFRQNGFPFGFSSFQQMGVPQSPVFQRQSIFSGGLPFHFKNIFNFPSFTQEDQIEIPEPVLQPFHPFPPFKPFSLFKDFPSKVRYISSSNPRPKCNKVLSNSGTVRDGMFDMDRALDSNWNLKSNGFDSSIEYVYEYELPSLVEYRRGRPTKKPNCPSPSTHPLILTSNPIITSMESEGKIAEQNEENTTQSTSPIGMSAGETVATEGMPSTQIQKNKSEGTEEVLTTELNFENISKNIDDEKLLKLFTYIFENRIDFLRAFISNRTKNTGIEGLFPKQKDTILMPSTTREGSYTQSSSTEGSSTTGLSTEWTSTESIPTMAVTQAVPVPPLEPASVLNDVPNESPTLGPVKPGVIPTELNYNEIDTIK